MVANLCLVFFTTSKSFKKIILCQLKSTNAAIKVDYIFAFFFFLSGLIVYVFNCPHWKFLPHPRNVLFHFVA